MKRMLTIDLLKGKGVPTRSDPNTIAFTAGAIAVPAILIIMMFGFYLKNNVIITVQQQKIKLCESNINKMSEAQALLTKADKEKKYADGCLSEAAVEIDKHYQWSPAIVEIVNLLPDSVLLKGIDVKQNMLKKVVPSKKPEGGEVEISIPITNVKINVNERSSSDRGQNMKSFQDSLRSSAVFSSLIDTINVSQGIETYKEQDFVTYQVDCSFKPKQK